MGDIIITKPQGPKLKQWSRYRGWTIRILEELEHSGGLTVAQIADRLNQPRGKIRVICNRLLHSSCIEHVEGWGWKITSHGLLLLLLQEGNTNITLTKHKHNTNVTLRQLTLAPYSNSEYSDPELAVTNLLISHYNATKEKFIFVRDQSDLAEKLEIPPDVLRDSLAKLREDGVCYLWYDRKYNQYQLRIKPAFLERLQHA